MRRARVSRLRGRGRQLHEPVLLGARADREPRLARRALPAALGRVRRRGAGARLRGRGDGDVPVRDRLPRRRGREAPWAGGPSWQALGAVARRRRAAGRDRRRDRPQGRRRARACASRSARSFGSPSEIGRLFLTDHLLAFEITSIVLLVAAVGGVILGSTLANDRRSEDAAAADGPEHRLVPQRRRRSCSRSGALGVLIRRSPLIVLLSLEIMLNGANLALIAFSRHCTTATGRSSRSP